MTAAVLRFGLLGPVELDTGTGPAPPGPPKQRALLALLLLAQGATVPVQRIVAALWDDRPPPSAVKNTQVYVYQLRKLVGDRLRWQPPGYRLVVAPGELDLAGFDAAVAAARAARAGGQLGDAIDGYARAAGLWRGDALADLVPLGLLAAQAEQLDARRLRAVEEHLAARLARGQHAEVADDAAALAWAHPLRERLHELHLLALHTGGRTAEAASAYRQVTQLLRRELGVPPGPALRRLGEAITRGEPAGAEVLTAGTLAAGVSVAPIRELPPDLGPLAGRGDELARLTAALTAALTAPVPGTGVVVVTGAAGTGKSTLACRLAHQIGDRYPDGALYVDLRATTAGVPELAPLEVLHRFLRTLGVPGAAVPADEAEATARYRSLVAHRRLLVVLDNAASAAQVRPLLPGGAHCAAIVTARRHLAELDATVHLPLEVLPEPAARELLERIAGTARVRAAPAATAEVLAWCGGLPLAIRIAAARLAARPRWGLAELAERLADAHRRLDELRLGDTAVRTAFAVSYDALRDPAAARLFRLLGLLEVTEVGPALAGALLAATPAGTREAAPEVVPAPGPQAPAADALAELADAHLVVEVAPGRYGLHDLLRLFARERCAATDSPAGRAAALDRATRYYLATAQRAAALLQPDRTLARGAAGGPGGEPLADRAAAIAWLETERTHLLAVAAQAAREPGPGAAVVADLARALYWFYRTRAYPLDWVALGRLALTVAQRHGDPAAIAQAHNDLGSAHERGYRLAEATTHLRAALRLYRANGDRRGEAATLGNLGIVLWRQRLYPQARRALGTARRRWRELGVPHSEARALTNLGLVHLGTGEVDAALRCYRAALDTFVAVDDQDGRMRALGNIAEAYRHRGEPAESSTHIEAALCIARELGDALTETELLLDLADTLALAGQATAALEQGRQALRGFRRIGYRFGEAEALARLAGLLHRAGDPAATAHWHQALDIFTSLGAPEATDVRAALAGAGAGGGAGAGAGAGADPAGAGGGADPALAGAG